MPSDTNNYLSHKSIAKNTLFNMAGYAIPLVAALFCLPIIIRGLGTDRFGILTLIWAVIGYFNLFDFGLGRALIHYLSESLLKPNSNRECTSLFWTSLILLIFLSLFATAVGLSITHWLVLDILRIPESLQQEAVQSFQLLFLCLPIFIFRIGLSSVLQAHHRFDLVNIIEVPVGTLVFIGAAGIVIYSGGLIHILLIIICARALSLFLYGIFIYKLMPYIKTSFTLSQVCIKKLFHFGGWMTVTNIVGPFLFYMDRFFIGSLISVSAVAYYTTPYEIVAKLWVIPASFARVLFPLFSSTFRTAKDKLQRLYTEGLEYTLLAIFPFILIIFSFCFEGLGIWINKEFAINSTSVMKWLAIGILINSLAQIAITVVQGIGRPDFSAKLHLIELPFYVVILLVLTRKWGIEGAAMAWVLRVLVDGIALFIFSFKKINIDKAFIAKFCFMCGLALTLIFSSHFIENFSIKLAYNVVILCCFAFLTWRHAIRDDDRKWIMGLIKNAR